MEITDSRLIRDIEEYCRVNEISDITLFAEKMLKKGFNIEKYGMAPPIDEKDEVVTAPVEPIREKPKRVSRKKQENITESTPVETISQEAQVEVEETVKTVRKTRKLK